MAKTDTSERWFERAWHGLTGVPQPEYSHELAPTDFAATHNGYVQGKPTTTTAMWRWTWRSCWLFACHQPKVVERWELAADGIKAHPVPAPPAG